MGVSSGSSQTDSISSGWVSTCTPAVTVVERLKLSGVGECIRHVHLSDSLARPYSNVPPQLLLLGSGQLGSRPTLIRGWFHEDSINDLVFAPLQSRDPRLAACAREMVLNLY